MEHRKGKLNSSLVIHGAPSSFFDETVNFSCLKFKRAYPTLVHDFRTMYLRDILYKKLNFTRYGRVTSGQGELKPPPSI